MKIKKSQLQQIIREEKAKLLSEGSEFDALRNQFSSVNDLGMLMHDINKGNAELEQAKDYIERAVDDVLRELYQGVFFTLDVDEAWMKAAFSEACSEFLR